MNLKHTNMNKSLVHPYIKTLFGLLAAGLLATACAPSSPLADGGEEDIIPGRPITFSTGSTDTRATQIGSLRGDAFGVKAFILTNPWASGGYNAKPDANWNNIRVDCDASGICTYTPRQLWQDNVYYTFFGYYPYSDPALTVSDANHESAPYLVYTPSPTDPTLHRDVMVAFLPDRTSTNTGQVRLQFSHVLFCVNVAVNNYNDEAIRLDNVVCQFQSSLYSSYRINMDKSAPAPNGSMTGSYPMAATATVQNTSSTGARNITDPDRFLMLIPQTGLQGKLTFTITRNDQSAYREVEFDDPDFVFRAGYRYTFTLYFVGAAIHFRIIQNNEWTDNDSQIEFD